VSNARVEPISVMLARWWAAAQAGDDTAAVLIIGRWRAAVIAAAHDENPAHNHGCGSPR
jgi:hypothetical protein